MVNVCLFLRNPSLQVALASGRRMVGVAWEVGLVGEEFSYLLISFPLAMRTRVLAVTWASGFWDPSWLQDGPAMENSSAFCASGGTLVRAGGRRRHCQGLGPGGGLAVVLHEAACTWLRPAGLPEAPPGTQVPSVEGRGVGKFALGHRLRLGWVVA